MADLGLILITAMFGILGFICFYFALKPYAHDDESFLEIFGYEFFLTLVFAFILWTCKKILPQNLYVFVFRVIVFIIGVPFLFGMGWVWVI